MNNWTWCHCPKTWPFRANYKDQFSSDNIVQLSYCFVILILFLFWQISCVLVDLDHIKMFLVTWHSALLFRQTLTRRYVAFSTKHWWSKNVYKCIYTMVIKKITPNLDTFWKADNFCSDLCFNKTQIIPNWNDPDLCPCIRWVFYHPIIMVPRQCSGLGTGAKSRHLIGFQSVQALKRSDTWHTTKSEKDSNSPSKSRKIRAWKGQLHLSGLNR